MPYNSSRAPQGAPKKSAHKKGGPSPKHRGYNAEAAASAGKKPRWSSEQRVANGHGSERPRGPRSEAPEGRPNWEPRGKDARASVERAPAARKRDNGYGDRPARSYDNDRPRRDFTDRPQRSFDGDRAPRRDDRAQGDRPQRSFGDRPQRSFDGDRAPRRDFNDRPQRSFTDRPQRSFDGDRAPRRDDRAQGDRPQRSFNDRPARSYDDRAPRRDFNDRPQRSFSDRPQRSFDGDRAPRRDDRAQGDRPQRSFNDRPARSYDDRAPRRDFGDRPQRSFDGDRPRRDFSDRAPRRDFTDRAPRRDFGDRAPSRDFGDRENRAPRPQVEDVVLERLEAQSTVAADVEGTTFGDLGLGDNIVRALAELGAAAPFAIQAATIPDVLSGGDVLGRGRTGSGKTIAFGAPLVERLLQMQAGDSKRREFGRAPRALILAPTRELALQIDRTVQPIARSVGLFTTQIYGGVPYARQLGALERGVDIIIGTPGRIQDLSANGRLDLSQVVITVLDEADHMCELGFAEPVTEILDRTAAGSQRLLFSATLDKGVADIVNRYLKDPAVHEVAGEDQASSTIEHRVLLLDQRDKQEVLIELASGPGKKLVFARTRAFAEQLADLLDEAGIRAESIHGDLNQSRRQRALEKFASGRVTALVATDVAARGIHVDDVGLVIQADAPDEYKAYLHRAGRTGRAGKEGLVVTLVPRNRRRRTEELLSRADIVAEWTEVQPGDELIQQLSERQAPTAE
ncbi:DEAD/DEAH box helicase [Salinibacterium sp. ZJ77]|uniref:DEAD/DEAH box helicase n=1 Tax=Salinibacterium sp. ZJ77 TaxID=2708337 RepID=UPI001421CEBB|nr:DEAD/DEAH box helicase [Salinibacterium sp. ZJ77]